LIFLDIIDAIDAAAYFSPVFVMINAGFFTPLFELPLRFRFHIFIGWLMPPATGATPAPRCFALHCH